MKGCDDDTAWKDKKDSKQNQNSQMRFYDDDTVWKDNKHSKTKSEKSNEILWWWYFLSRQERFKNKIINVKWNFMMMIRAEQKQKDSEIKSKESNEVLW